jgi:RNA polymerase sigma-70 factor, ECF subfamily
MDSSSGEVTLLLKRLADGDQDAAAELVPVVYDELRRIATIRLRREHPGHTLQATALVHEAYIKLVGGPATKWQNRAQFFGVASQVMRRILVDYARAQLRSRRGGRPRRISLDEVVLISPNRTEELLTVHDSLLKLEKLDPRQSRVVELRYFGGLSVDEIAEVVGVTPRTVARDLSMAKAWLYGELSERDPNTTGP